MDATFGKMKYLRTRFDMPIKVILKECNVSRAAYYNYENCERIPPIDFLISLANLYNVSLDYLCNREYSENELINEFLNDLNKFEEMVASIKSKYVKR